MKLKSTNKETKTGKVYWFNPRKGYGFIKTSDGEQFFVHFSDIEMEGFRNLKRYETVVFSVEGNNKAVNVKNLGYRPNSK